MSARYAVGIDLGTTHCAMARVRIDAPDAETEVLEVAQLVRRGARAERTLLPSFLYLPPHAEGPQPLAWDPERAFAVGEYARARAAEAPGRVIASAKSWLCHTGIDRRGEVLPTAAPDDVEKMRPPVEIPLTAEDKRLVKAGEGLLEVVAGRNDEVFVGGRRIGKGPSVKVSLPLGARHEVRVKLRGEERVRYVTVKKGVRTRVRVAPPWSR